MSIAAKASTNTPFSGSLGGFEPVEGPIVESARKRASRRMRKREDEARRCLREVFPDIAVDDLPCEVISWRRDRILARLGGSLYYIGRS